MSYFCKIESKQSIYFARKKIGLLSRLNGTLWDLPSPSVISYFWNFGSMLGFCLILQIVTGLFLRFHYISHSPERFSSVVAIMREVWSGWLIRYLHINGASLFFVFIYLHLFRGVYFIRAVHKSVWIRGVIILLVLMAISFLGYVLPWGQMSYWGVAVITNLFSVVPIIGEGLVHWLWGGFSVRSPTLVRFYSFHFLFPFILRFLVLIHLINLHKEGSRNRLGLNRNVEKVFFHPYFTTKDLSFALSTIFLFRMVVIYYPNLLGDPVNNIPANFMQTPVHIQPEWYFLPSYAILRAIPRKVAGVIFLALSVTIYLVLPFYDIKFSVKFSLLRSLIFWIFIIRFMVLGVMGAMPAEEPFIFLRKLISFLYFISIIIINL